MKLYMQNDRVRNILHDNENLKKFGSSGGISVGASTTFTKMNNTQTNFATSPKSQTFEPSRFA